MGGAGRRCGRQLVGVDENAAVAPGSAAPRADLFLKLYISLMKDALKEELCRGTKTK